MANSQRKENGEIGKYDKTKSLFFQHTCNHRGCHDDRIRFKITFYINNIPTDRSMETCIITGSVGILFFVMLFILHCQSLPM